MVFEEFVATYSRSLLGLASAMTGDIGLAEDLVQEILIKAHRRWDKIEDLGQPTAYVRRMLVNEFVSWRRKWGRVTPLADVTVLDDAPDPATRHADRQALDIQISRLPRQQRVALALRYFAGLGDDEIADALGCQVMTVRSYISRALATLRTHPDALLTTDVTTAPTINTGRL